MGFFSPPKLRIFSTAERPSKHAADVPEQRRRWSYDDGSKWNGGFGPTRIVIPDYWTLRTRSDELFETNLYARGLIRRLVTNEINTGLSLEAMPEEQLLGYPEDGLAGWSETVENRWAIWASTPWLCDQTEQCTFGQLQAAARLEALKAGDVLVTLAPEPRTGLPRIKLYSGSVIQMPWQAPKIASGNRIDHGVERDAQGRHVAYWIAQCQQDGFGQQTFKRLPAYGEKSGRRLAWLLYGTDKKLDDVRGKPMLSLMLQSLKDLDRYRESAQRKAVINSMLAMFISKGEDKPSSKPITGSAIRRGTEATIANDGTARSYKAAEQIPGLVLEELQHGEEPKAFPANGTDEKFGEFERAMTQLFAWANEIPPENLVMSFNSNYSASKAANNEFEMYLNRARTDFGNNFCQLVYQEWLPAEVRAQRIEARGLLESVRDLAKYDTFGAWTTADWTGQIKPSIDPVKMVNALKGAVEQGFTTRTRAAREFSGTKFSKNVQQTARENMALFEANKPLAELEAMKKGKEAAGPSEAARDSGPEASAEASSEPNEEPTNESGPDEDSESAAQVLPFRRNGDK
jgi:lambda family phage portal protein